MQFSKKEDLSLLIYSAVVYYRDVESLLCYIVLHHAIIFLFRRRIELRIYTCTITDMEERVGFSQCSSYIHVYTYMYITS